MKATLDDSTLGPHDKFSSLFVLARLGDADAAARLYNQCVPPLRSWLACRMPWTLADDTAHDAMVIAFAKSASFSQGQALLPWLRRIAWNLARNHRRNEARRRHREAGYIEIERLNAEASEGGELPRLTALSSCVDALPERHRHLLHLRFDQGLLLKTIAASESRNRAAISVSLHRICRRLRSDVERTLRAAERGEPANPPATAAAPPAALIPPHKPITIFHEPNSNLNCP